MDSTTSSAAADNYPDWTAPADRDLLETTCPAELAHWRAIRARRKALGNDIEARLRLWPELARAYSAIAAAFQYRPVAKKPME